MGDDLDAYSADAKARMLKRLEEEKLREAEEMQRNLDAITYSITFNPAEAFDKDEFIPAKMARSILSQLPRNTLVTPSGTTREKQTYWYNSHLGIYKPNGSAWIEKLSHKLLKDYSKNARISEVVGAIQRETLDLSDTFHNETPGYLVLENGCLRVEDRTLFHHTPEVRSFNRIPVKYDPDADCPMFKKFLSEVIDGDYRLGVQEWFGYTLLKGSHPIRKAFMGLGEGSNGKSTLLEVWAKFLGIENTTNVPLHEIGEDRFAVAEMFGKLANFCPDLPSVALKVTTTFKALTGYDQIKAQRKFGQPFTFYSYCKQIFTMNKLPTTWDKSKAFFDRVYLVPFMHIFEGQNRLPRDQLVAVMITPEELSGILNWALDGLKRLLEKGEFTGSMSSEQMEVMYEKMSNPVGQWCDNCLDFEAESFVVKEDAYGAFVSYCHANKYPAASVSAFKPIIKKVMNCGEQKRTVAGERKHVWSGIVLRCVVCENRCLEVKVSPQKTLDGGGVQTVQTVQPFTPGGTFGKVGTNVKGVDTLDTLDTTTNQLKVLEFIGNREVDREAIIGKFNFMSSYLDRLLELMVRDKVVFECRVGWWRRAT